MLNACERDDICIDPITPKLTIRFYNNDEPTTLKSVSNIQVRIDTLSEPYTDNSLTIRSSTDSIAIPLRVDQTVTKILLTENSTNDTDRNTDTLEVSYTPESIFVSRSCGYKDVFNNVSYRIIPESDGGNWLKGIETVTVNIENEDQANVKIFH
ncbi:MAG: hypothetical protein KDC69_08475, partial [Flavobacteriaceae bacterium]|nr:hypothetical protein [Flavobacteriaceae bacterium]